MPTQYATTTDLASLGLASGALSRLPIEAQTAALMAASAYADGYLRAKPFTLPLTAWGDDLREAVCCIAAADLSTTHGWNPEDPANKALLDRADRWRAWLRDVARGLVEITVVDSTPDLDEPSTFCSTRARRGWRRY